MPNYNFSYKKKDRKAFLYGTLPKIHFRIKNCLAIYFYRKEVPNNTFYIKKNGQHYIFIYKNALQYIFILQMANNTFFFKKETKKRSNSCLFF